MNNVLSGLDEWDGRCKRPGGRSHGLIPKLYFHLIWQERIENKQCNVGRWPERWQPDGQERPA